MNKNWLIRTKNNHILGPVSLDKIKTLLENKSLNSEDELCSGNGYWFSVKEDDLISKYIHNNEQQSFNPISEAKTVLARDMQDIETSSEFDEVQDVTQIGLSLDDLNTSNSKVEVELLDLGEPPTVKLPIKPDIKKKVEAESKEINEVNNFSTTELKSVKSLNSTILYIIAIIFFALALVGFYYRKTLLENFLG